VFSEGSGSGDWRNGIGVSTTSLYAGALWSAFCSSMFTDCKTCICA